MQHIFISEWHIKARKKSGTIVAYMRQKFANIGNIILFNSETNVDKFQESNSSAYKENFVPSDWNK